MALKEDSGPPPQEETLQQAVDVIFSGTQKQRHLGIRYSDAANRSYALHLAWHCNLHNDPWDKTKWFSFSPPFHPLRLEQVAALCRRLWRMHGKQVTYAFSIPDATMMTPDTGQIVLGDTKYGFTCASFVITLFESVGIPLILLESWPNNRDGDSDWQNFIVGVLRENGHSDHADKVEREIGVVRFRPEEVAAACEYTPPPATFKDIEDRSIEIIQLLPP